MTVEGIEQPTSGNHSNGPGRILAEQREALGWSVEQVADQLKLAVRQVVAIEAGDKAGLPPAAVVRGFVRAYAKILRLDPAPLVAMIPLESEPVTDSAAVAARREKAASASMSQVRFSSGGARRRLPWGAIGGVVAAVAIGVAVWQFAPVTGMFGAPGTETPNTTVLPPPATASGNVTELPSPVAGTAAPSGSAAPVVAPGALQNPSVPLISVPPQSQPSTAGAGASTPAPAATGTAPAATVAPATAATPAATPAAATGGDALVLSVKEDSWIEVRRASGRPLLSKLVKAGSVETVEIKEPVTLVVGKAAAVQATLRGAPLPITPTKGTVARLSVQ